MQTKTCSKCHREQPTAQFYKRQQLIDGLSSYCKTCWKEINNDRRGQMKAQQAVYRKTHKKQRKALQDEYYKKFKEQILAKKRKAYAEKKKSEKLNS